MQPNINLSIIELKMKNFETELLQMSKPEISELQHQDMLENAIVKAKDKSVLSWWWLSIPIYVLAALLMKSFFMPSETLLSGLHNLTGKAKYSSVLFFLIVPIFFIIINSISIKKIYFLSGNPKSLKFLQAVWFNLLVIITSIIIVLIYSL